MNRFLFLRLLVICRSIFQGNHDHVIRVKSAFCCSAGFVYDYVNIHCHRRVDIRSTDQSAEARKNRLDLTIQV